MASAAIAPTSEKVYACPTCSRVFNKKANLKVHSRKHTGEKPYACSRPGCNRRFMWKSSVTFHEQNCPSLKRESSAMLSDANSYSHPGLYAGGDIPLKRPKVQMPMHAPGPVSAQQQPQHQLYNQQQQSYSQQPILTREAQYQSSHVPLPPTPQGAAQVRMSPIANPHPPQSVITAATPETSVASNAQEERTLPTTPTTPAESPPRVTESEGNPLTGLAQLRVAHQYPPSVTAGLTQQKPAPPTGTPQQYPPRPASRVPTGKGYQQTAPHGVEQNFTTYAESPSLPAPSTILYETKKVASAGRPPIIPPSLPKPYYSSKTAAASIEPTSNTQRALFDLKVTGKPFGSKMPKMPIAMDFDDSDDEAPVKVIGAQDAFMRTGNPFTGFAPPTRCSPLPASSPIVIGVSPMPLSPLAPFSPLPPDSPAHNAPNPVHPPLNIQSQRTANPNF